MWAIVLGADPSKVYQTFFQRFDDFKKNLSSQGLSSKEVKQSNETDSFTLSEFGVPETNSTNTILRGMLSNATSEEVKAGTVSIFFNALSILFHADNTNLIKIL